MWVMDAIRNRIAKGTAIAIEAWYRLARRLVGDDARPDGFPPGSDRSSRRCARVHDRNPSSVGRIPLSWARGGTQGGPNGD